MMDLPLFPLNTVLFPGMPLSLHIFENRYKEMINTCLTEKMPFGVVLISQGDEALGPLAEPHHIGCTAKIGQVQPLVHGRMNLVAVGESRFRIYELDRESQSYLVAKVELEPMSVSNPERLLDLGEKLRPQVIRYLDILSQAGDVEFDPSQLPQNPVELANLAAFLVRVEAQDKQTLLASESAVRFVGAVRTLFSRENALLETMIEHSQRDDHPGPFSLN